jgi:hypothetical protein
MRHAQTGAQGRHLCGFLRRLWAKTVIDRHRLHGLRTQALNRQNQRRHGIATARHSDADPPVAGAGVLQTR